MKGELHPTIVTACEADLHMAWVTVSNEVDFRSGVATSRDNDNMRQGRGGGVLATELV